MQHPGIFGSAVGLCLAGDGAGAKPCPAGIPAAGHGGKPHKIAFSRLRSQARRHPAPLAPLISKIRSQNQGRVMGKAPAQRPLPGTGCERVLGDFKKSTWILPSGSAPRSCSSLAPGRTEGCYAAHSKTCRYHPTPHRTRKYVTFPADLLPPVSLHRS